MSILMEPVQMGSIPAQVGQVGVPTEELCKSGEHKMRFMSFEDALTGPLSGTSTNTIACQQCNFLLDKGQSERLFICVICRADQRTVHRKHSSHVVYNRKHIFCETCVASNKVVKEDPKPGFTTGLFECGGEMNHFCDSLFFFPCKLGRIAHWVQFKYNMDGEVHGEGDAYPQANSLGCCICAFTSICLMSATCMDLGTSWLLIGGGVGNQTKDYAGIATDGCCWDFICCPICAIARYQREIKIHRGEEVPGCCAGPSWKELKAHRRPQHVAYTRLAPVPIAAMGAAMGQVMSAVETNDPWGAPVPVQKEQPPLPQQEGQQPFCPSCGRQFGADHSFCSGCGAKRQA